MSFLKSFSTFSSFTFISRILGFFRDIINARVLGAGMLSDAFFIAFRLPNLFRSLFAEGAMNSAFIPIYSKKLTHNEIDTPQFVGKIIFLIGIFLIFFCGLAEIFMREILSTIAPGFEKENEYFEVGIILGRIMFPFLFFITITAIYGCTIQSHGKFIPTSSYPIIMNIVLIIASFTSFLIPVYSLSYGVIISGIFQLIFLISSAKYYKIPIGFPLLDKTFFNYDIKHFFRKLLPSILTSCVTRIGITIDMMIASSTVGAVSYIYYSDRLYQLPLSIIGVTLANVLLPSLSKITSRITYYKENQKHEEHKELSDKLEIIQSRIFEFAFILILPATIGLYLLAEDICALIFGNNSGNFSQDALKATGDFLKILCLALPANILNNIFNSILFANHITKFTTKTAIYTLILNLTVNFTLFYKFKYGYQCVAIATVASSYFNAIILGFFCKKHNFLNPIHDLSRIRYIFFTNMGLVFIIVILDLLKNTFLIQFTFKWNLFLIIEILTVIYIYFKILNYKGQFKLNDFKKLFID